MARLQWDNIATPDLTAAAALQQNANKALTDAISGVDTFVTGLSDRQRAQVQRDLAQRINSYLDRPDQLRADVASGALFEGVPQRYLTPDMINGVRTTADQFLESLTKHRTDGRNEREYTISQEARPLLNQMEALRIQGRNAEADALLAQNPQLLGMKSSDYQTAVDRSRTAAQGYRTETDARENFTLEREKEAFLADAQRRSITPQ